MDENELYNYYLDRMVKDGLLVPVRIVGADYRAREYLQILHPEWRKSDLDVKPDTYDFHEQIESLGLELVSQRRGKPGSQLEAEMAERGVHGIYRFGHMAVGETFSVAAGPDQPQLNSFRVYCSKRGKELKRKFSCHVQPDRSYLVTRTA